MANYFKNAHYPITDKHIDSLVCDIEDDMERDIERAILKEHTLAVVEPGFVYFKKNVLAGHVGANLELFKAVRVANPAYVKHTLVSRGLEGLQQDVRSLSVLKCVTEQNINSLLAKLPVYSQACTDFAGEWLFTPPLLT